MAFPINRSRRLRKTENLRRMMRETQVSAEDFIAPLFVCPGEGIRKEVPSMPGVFQMSVDEAVKECRVLDRLGVPAVILFGIPESKDALGTGAYDDSGIIQTANQAIKEAVPDLVLINDLCFCEYTDHGHCGVVRNSDVDNDATLDLIRKTAVSQVNSGADMLAPSGMMDGAVKAIREALDATGAYGIPIMAYSAKYSSGFYGPFRDAAGSAPGFGNRKTYQMDPANRREALAEVALDLAEGADIVMVKPALAYLDVIREVRNLTGRPVAAYNVSGEYAMVKAAGKMGWIDENTVMWEILTGIKRAGADLILTYFAHQAAEELQK
ncbi:delta-aminolevulinic acid dehydratase [bacterium BMS3Abin05]|nr:delta-aminolevulinic acid dehydratase [bacterium BMS3Abin05]GBE28409.1 delta-aminolevulinic acid dehydratase [bacterium BMS3Bbin03]HDZ11692.1 porphobilinogen synthase [Bacteroidota bacterium]